MSLHRFARREFCAKNAFCAKRRSESTENPLHSRAPETFSAKAGNTKLDKRTTQKRISIDAENENGQHAEEREERRAR